MRVCVCTSMSVCVCVHMHICMVCACVFFYKKLYWEYLYAPPQAYTAIFPPEVISILNFISTLFSFVVILLYITLNNIFFTYAYFKPCKKVIVHSFLFTF